MAPNTIAQKSANNLHPNLGPMFEHFSAQTIWGLSNKWMNDHCAPAGRIKARPKPIAEPEPELTIDVKFVIRPNGEKYFTRKWGQHDDILVMQNAREKGLFVFLNGAPGCGKTSLVEAAYGEDLVTLVCSGDTEVSDLVGSYVQHGDEFIWIDGPLLVAAERGVPLLLDEIGLADSKALTPLYGFMDGRDEYFVSANPERGTVKAKPGFFVVGATNPNAPGVRMSEALLSRFSLHVEMTTDWALATEQGVPTQVVTVAQNLDGRVRMKDLSWAPQFRELIAFRDISAVFGHDFAVANLIAAAPEFDRAEIQKAFHAVSGRETTPARI